MVVGWWGVRVWRWWWGGGWWVVGGVVVRGGGGGGVVGGGVVVRGEVWCLVGEVFVCGLR